MWTRDYQLLYPPVVRFGWGCHRSLTELVRETLGDCRVFIVASRSVERSGTVDQLADTFGHACRGRWSAVPHDPPLTCVDNIAAAMREAQAEAVVAIGGGSVIDAAKAAAAIAPHAGARIQPFFDGVANVNRAGLPLFALPTTAGTGAEITQNAVLSDPATLRKKSVRSRLMVPAAAVVDPELTLTMPPGLTAASGLDALTQAIESYLSVRANQATAALALRAVALLFQALPAAYADGACVSARTQAAEGSLLSAMAFSQSSLGAVHGLAHPIGAVTGMAHGRICAILLPHVLHCNAEASRERLDELAGATNTGTARCFVRTVEELCRNLDIPPDFRGLGLRREHIDHVVANCRSSSMASNPRHLSDSDVRRLLETLT